MDVGVTFGLRLPLGQHPVPLCLWTKDAIPFWREGRRVDVMKLRDLEKERGGGSHIVLRTQLHNGKIKVEEREIIDLNNNRDCSIRARKRG